MMAATMTRTAASTEIDGGPARLSGAALRAVSLFADLAGG